MNSTRFNSATFNVFAVALIAGRLGGSMSFATDADSKYDGPRIVNIYNFIRNSDYRLRDSENLMFDCTRKQIELLKKYNLPATWALQYDALTNPRYPKLLKEQLGTNDEIAAWWEIPKPLVEKAGLKWRGRYEWDPEAHVGFSPGYTPAERRKLVDVYMADFKAIFGHYPRTVGSWFIDEVTLEYMATKYGIVASCNCKDQIGTDFYTLWGGYWGQAYYPSRVNAYMPAQTSQGQIDIPVFRMLGSDPIYQHGSTPGLISLEPVYNNGGGGMPRWVDWFMDSLVEEPCLAFAFTQAGQENSFTWKPMEKGLTYQIPLLARMAKSGKVRIETLEQAGQWFKCNFKVTPATSVVALDDWKNEGHKTVWYDSRFYRLNILWQDDSFFIRDIHCFDENIVSPTHDTPLRQTSLVYETLPIVDWATWSHSGHRQAGMWPVLHGADGAVAPMQPEGAPVVKDLDGASLRIDQSLKGGGSFSIVCTEGDVTLTAVDAKAKPLNWSCDIAGGDGLKSMIREIGESAVALSHSGVDYRLKLGSHAGSFQPLPNGGLRLLPGEGGRLVLKLNTSNVAAAVKKADAELSRK